MSTYISPYDTCFNPTEPYTTSGNTTKIQDENALSELSRITDKSSISALSPRIHAVLNEISSPEGDITNTMRSNINNLQDGFVDTLYATLNENNVEISEKITLHLDSNDNLVVGENRADKAELDIIIAKTPELSVAFKEISSQSELLRDINNISKVMSRSGIEHYENQAMKDNSAFYQMSIKGDMSHFYFSKP